MYDWYGHITPLLPYTKELMLVRDCHSFVAYIPNWRRGFGKTKFETDNGHMTHVCVNVRRKRTHTTYCNFLHKMGFLATEGF